MEPNDLTPALSAARLRRKTLHDTIVHLEEAIASPAAGRIDGWTAGVLKEVVEVREAFDQHVLVTEREEGLYDESWSVRRASPTTSRVSERSTPRSRRTSGARSPAWSRSRSATTPGPSTAPATTSSA